MTDGPDIEMDNQQAEREVMGDTVNEWSLITSSHPLSLRQQAEKVHMTTSPSEVERRPEPQSGS